MVRRGGTKVPPLRTIARSWDGRRDVAAAHSDTAPVSPHTASILAGTSFTVADIRDICRTSPIKRPGILGQSADGDVPYCRRCWSSQPGDPMTINRLNPRLLPALSIAIAIALTTSL